MPPKNIQIDLSTLPESIGAIFDQVQHSLANHKKNSVALYKLHLAASSVTKPVSNGGVKIVGEKKFGDIFIDMVNRVLVVKKGPVTADRIVKFVGGYVKHLNEKVMDEKFKQASSSSISASKRQMGEEDEDEDGDTFATRFVSRLLNWLFRGFEAKNKNVRYRSVFIVSEMMAYIGEIDEDTYAILKESLIQRISDKESLIRAHSVIALSKLIDPAAEVRRAALLSVPLIPTTLPIILTRTRDTDTVTRRLMHSSVLATKLSHPRQLTISQREQIVKDGLGDREPVVRVAAGRLITSWFDVILAEIAREEGECGQEETQGWKGDDLGIMRGLVAFLGLFDVVGPGEAVAVDAVLSIFVTRSEIPDVFIFTEEFWSSLTPESAVLARIFVEHAASTKKETLLETASIPVVTAFAFHIQEAYNLLLDALQEAEAVLLDGREASEELEEDMAKLEVMLGELLRISLKLDYGDEIGRRKVFSVVRDILAHPQLPPGLIEQCLDVLKEIMPSERDLIRLVVEIIVELRDDHGDALDSTAVADDPQADRSFIQRELSIRRKKERHQMSEEECLQADTTDVRCLMLCIAVLERVNGSFEDNSTLEGILADLIIPSVKRKELVMREKALISLGLCCLIAKNMALSSFQLFVSQVQSAPDELRVQVLRTILDLLFMYDQELFGKSEDIAIRIIEFLLHTLEAEEYAAAQAVLCIGICKLLLAEIITDSKMLTALILIYVSSSTYDNLEARQCLSYFFPMYCYSSPEHQRRMASVFMVAFDLVTRMHEDHDDNHNMISPYQFALQLVDWTNPVKAAEIQRIDDLYTPEIHVELGVDIVSALYDSDRTEEDQKVLCQLLNQLVFPPAVPERSLHKLDILLTYHEQQCPFDNQTIVRSFVRFRQRFHSVYRRELENLNPRKYRDEEFRKLYEYIAVDMPDMDSEIDEPVEQSEVDDGPKSEAVGEEAYTSGNEDINGHDTLVASGVDENAESVIIHGASATVEHAESSDSQAEEVYNDDRQEGQEQSESSTDEQPFEEESGLSPLRKHSSPKTSKQLSKSRGRGQAVQKRGTSHPRKPVSLDAEKEHFEETESPQQEVAPSSRKRGTKRSYVPEIGGQLKSPGNRKRNRIRSPRYENISTESEGESTPTEQKPALRRNAKRNPSPTDDSDDEHIENRPRTTLLDETSDDLAGYSD
ncbi:nuclear condensing complex subunit [Cyathus striatus]|nr:nuclear condensing complex subunit [Cyathus striatus]